MKFHHIGYATINLDESINAFKKLGFAVGEIINDDYQNVRIAVLSKSNHPLIELITPKNNENPINRYIKDNNTAPYHIAYTVKNINDAVSLLRKKGFVVATKIMTSVAFNSNKMIFLYNKQTGLIELIEE